MKIELPQDRRGLIKLLREAAHARSLYDVFRDFCELSACCISSAVEIGRREEREAAYQSALARYDERTRVLFPQMFACLVGELESGHADVLGSVFMEMEIGNKHLGQFFTPYSLCRAIARMQIDESLGQIIERNGYVTVNEPCSGGGAMVIAFAEELRAAGYNPQTQMHVVAQDMDPRSVHMTYVQLSLLGIPAAVILGDTIRMEARDTWHTPRHVLDLWSFKLRRPRAEQPQIEIASAPIVPLIAEQMVLL